MNKLDQVTRLVCDEFEVAYADVRGRTKIQHIAEARQAAIVLCTWAGIPILEIGAYFQRHRTLLIKARHKIASLEETYPAFKNKMAVLRRKVRE